nr:locomotion-related protein Hikaru genki-like [Dermatophagoides farinae]
MNHNHHYYNENNIINITRFQNQHQQQQQARLKKAYNHHHHQQQQSESTTISYLPTIDGHQKAFISNNNNHNNNQPPLTLGSCTSPEVMVNGAPSPDIAGTVSGGEWGSIEEIQFVGMVMSPPTTAAKNNDNNSDGHNDDETIDIKQKRICKIKCLNGVWIGPFCAFQTADEYEPILRSCRVPIIANGSIIIIDSKNTYNHNYYNNDDDHHHHHHYDEKMKKNYRTKPRELPHGSIIKVKCKEIGMFKLTTMNGNDTIQCLDGKWDQSVIPHCEPTTLHMNFSLSSPPSILYTLLDGTLGINDFDDDSYPSSFQSYDDYYEQQQIYEQNEQQQPQIVISPGSILHLDCVFQETFGQPQWSVSDIPQIYYDSEHQHGTAINNNKKIDSSSSSSSSLFDQHHYHQLHHTQILNEQHWNPNQMEYQNSEHQRQQQQHKYQYSLSRNKHLRRNKYQNRRKHYYQQSKPGSSANIRTHTTGWAILTDKHSWKYRLAIYYASETDTGRYTCTTPNGQSNYMDIVVKDVQCPSLEELKQQQQNIDNDNDKHNPYRDDPNRLATKTGYHMHDRIRFSCIDGYRLYGGHREVKCLPNGHWSHPFPICQEISCPDYVNLKDLDPNLFITYERLSSSSNVQQQQQQQQNDMDFDNDFFSHSLSSLSSGHHHDHHGHHNNHHLLDRQALRFRCPIGYRLIGSSLIKCDHIHNEWSETFPKCQQLQCPEPEPPSNGKIIIKSKSGGNQLSSSSSSSSSSSLFNQTTTTVYLVGDYIQFGCRKGYRMIGSDIITCLHTEQWSSLPPKCKQVCSYPAKLLHGYYEPVKFHYNVGDIVHVHCDNGFRLAKEFEDNLQPLHFDHNNNETITMLCSNDGLWIGPAIKCKRQNNNKQQQQQMNDGSGGGGGKSSSTNSL